MFARNMVRPLSSAVTRIVRDADSRPYPPYGGPHFESPVFHLVHPCAFCTFLTFHAGALMTRSPPLLAVGNLWHQLTHLHRLTGRHFLNAEHDLIIGRAGGALE